MGKLHRTTPLCHPGYDRTHTKLLRRNCDQRAMRWHEVSRLLSSDYRRAMSGQAIFTSTSVTLSCSPCPGFFPKTGSSARAVCQHFARNCRQRLSSNFYHIREFAFVDHSQLHFPAFRQSIGSETSKIHLTGTNDNFRPQMSDAIA